MKLRKNCQLSIHLTAMRKRLKQIWDRSKEKRVRREKKTKGGGGGGGGGANIVQIYENPKQTAIPRKKT